MKFVPNSSVKTLMLKELGLKKFEDLFSDIPQKIKIKDLNLPKGLTQQDTERKLKNISDKNKSYNDFLCFLGGGIKPHYVPAIVKSLVSRSEFYTAYTPYQSEASQGFLQAMFEYQSMVAEITGMDVANCSLYDGVTSLSEAALMCNRITRKKKFIIPNNISWEKKCVLNNYAKGPGIQIKEISYDKKTGKIDIDKLNKNIDKDTSGVYIENPNFFGIFEDDVEEINDIIKKAGSLCVVGVDPISLGITKSPGEYGADIVIGEGRALGNFMNYGGSSLGIFACKKDFLRQIPGRIIGITQDTEEKRAFCMTLQTREQHIRRAKATSNICTNEGLCALSALIYLSWLGSDGLFNLSKTNFEIAEKLSKSIDALNGFKLKFNSTHFNEFVIECSDDVNKLNKRLLQKNIQGGLILDEFYSELKNCMLIGTSEVHTEGDIKRFTSSLKEVSHV